MRKSYIIDMEPTAWKRAGLNTRGNKGYHFYDAQRHLKNILQITLGGQHGDLPYFTGPISIDFKFWMKMPNRTKDKTSFEGTPTCKKPDLDNLIKLILDTLSSIAYADDAIIYKIHAERLYSSHPRTEFTIEEYNDNKKEN